MIEEDHSIPKKKTEFNNSFSFAECCAGFFICIPLAVSFGIFTSDNSYYTPCSSLSSTYTWSHITFISLLIQCSTTILFLPFVTNLVKSKTEKPNVFTVFLGAISSIIRIGGIILSLVCFSGLCYSYGENENCGNLNQLVLAYIILVSIGLGCIALNCCIAICCMGGVALLAIGFQTNLDQAENNKKDSINLNSEDQGKEPFDPIKHADL